jgi:hypothetical protein
MHNILVIDILGPSLEDLFDMCGRQFSPKTVAMVAKQMVGYLLFTVRCCSVGKLSHPTLRSLVKSSRNVARTQSDLQRYQTRQFFDWKTRNGHS